MAAALAVVQEGSEKRMANGEGFTAEDRKSLNILENEMKHITMGLQELSTRLAKLEDAKVSAHDLEQTYIEVDELRQKKADKVIMDDHEVRIRNIEKRIWMWLGGALAVSAILQVLLAFLKR